MGNNKKIIKFIDNKSERGKLWAFTKTISLISFYQ